MDDILLYEQPGDDKPFMTLHHLRQQLDRRKNAKPNYALSDFIAPRDSGKRDWLGAFAVTAGIGIDEHVKRFEADHDDYSAIMLKALADRLAEALAEHTHRRVRRTLWAYDPEETLDNEALIKEDYRGIRPAPGYPACPDHSEKEKIFELLDAERNSKMKLTSGFAMLPASSVSGYYFAHPQSCYFVLGNILEDQLLDYAKRKNISPEKARRLLVANTVL